MRKIPGRLLLIVPMAVSILLVSGCDAEQLIIGTVSYSGGSFSTGQVLDVHLTDNNEVYDSPLATVRLTITSNTSIVGYALDTSWLGEGTYYLVAVLSVSGRTLDETWYGSRGAESFATPAGTYNLTFLSPG